ncbi:MAG: radical SAM protein, partial [Lysobacter sp.]|nr:radical SAM protein [Lysobacter sp.]
PDIAFGQSVNPYRGCEHGCVYCFARPSHAYLELSPGLDFETRLFAKVNAAERLQNELARPGYRCVPIALGINTDSYQPIERRFRITRGVMEVLDACSHPFSLITKNASIVRDVELLASMAKRGLVSVYFSVTTLDNQLSAKMEPRASAPHSRLKAMRTLAEAGVPVGVMVAPTIPMINDGEIEHILAAAYEAGARAAGYVVLRLMMLRAVSSVTRVSGRVSVPSSTYTEPQPSSSPCAVVTAYRPGTYDAEPRPLNAVGWSETWVLRAESMRAG